MSKGALHTSLKFTRAPDVATLPAQAARIKLAEAEDLRLKRQYDKALGICDSLMAKYPNYVGALQTAGLICADKRDDQRALGYLTRALMLCPENWPALTALSSVYLQLGATEMAAKVLEQASALAPNDLSVRTTLAMIYHEKRDYERAATLYREVLDSDANFAGAAVGFAMSCIELGWYAEAAATLERLISQSQQSIRIIHLLARLPLAFVSVDLNSLAKRVAKSALDAPGEYEQTLAYLQGVIQARLGNHEAAWKCLQQANRLSLAGREAERDKTATIQKNTLAIARKNTAGLFLPVAPSTDDPISLFILGPSRSGKTSLERLLGAIPGVKLGYENPIADNAVRKTLQLSGYLSSGRFLDLPPVLESACRQRYLEELRIRAAGASIFTNTEPSLISDVPRIAGIIPNARFIFIKRDPYDVMLQIFMTRYRFGNAYAYDLKSIWEHLDWYFEMIDMMKARYSTVSTVINYEDMVSDPASALKIATQLCGLEMNTVVVEKIGDDTGCAKPYRELIKQELGFQLSA